jgi:predicted SAM-dependent methyltransferase
MRTFLHVGCGPLRKEDTTRGFAQGAWKEVRLDIDHSVQPDVVGTLTDMAAVPDASVQALFSSHNIEHLYAHEVPVALREFRRVLDDVGFLILTCPDLQSMCALVAQDKLLEPAYQSSMGPISPHDALYGHGKAIAAGNAFMAHRCGFTQRVLEDALVEAGFGSVASIQRDAPFFDLWAVATKLPQSRDRLLAIAGEHFPA